jgi:NAD(P)H-dependent flavin oxidoreductase YrpB (nitropropane dioxygenase family)
MNTSNLLSLIDAEIATLKQARTLIAGSGVEVTKPTRGRPKGSKNAPAKKKRNLSPEGRARIAAAVKRRWALQKKAAK